MVAVRKSTFSGMTVAEFLDWNGDGTDTRYELVNGEPRAMAPASVTHAYLQVALARLIEGHLIEHGSPCRAATEAPVVPGLSSNVNLRVPDLAVTCAPDDPDARLLPDPVLIVEILSPGNERETRSNLWAYASIPSVQEILFVQSTRVGAELHRRCNGDWPTEPIIIGPDDELVLVSIGYRVPLIQVYARTKLVRQPD